MASKANDSKGEKNVATQDADQEVLTAVQSLFLGMETRINEGLVRISEALLQSINENSVKQVELIRQLAELILVKKDQPVSAGEGTVVVPDHFVKGEGEVVNQGRIIKGVSAGL